MFKRYFVITCIVVFCLFLAMMFSRVVLTEQSPVKDPLIAGTTAEIPNPKDRDVVNNYSAVVRDTVDSLDKKIIKLKGDTLFISYPRQSKN